MIFRQGDVLIESVSAIPKKVKVAKRENGRIILAYGEATGHAHAIADQSTKSFVDESGTLFLSVKAGTKIQHQEHLTVNLPVGNYKITIQREYTPEGLRNVHD